MTKVVDMEEFRASTVQVPVAPVPLAYLQHVRKINDVFLDQIRSCDQKAAYIFTVMLAFLATSSEDKTAFAVARHSGSINLATVISVSFTLASALSFVSAILVVLPRHVSRSTSLFWGCWMHHKDSLRQAAIDDDQSYLFNQYVDNADVLALIAARKYRLVRLAFRALLFAALCYVALRMSVDVIPQ
jgi:hypothetical protein